MGRTLISLGKTGFFGVWRALGGRWRGMGRKWVCSYLILLCEKGVKGVDLTGFGTGVRR
jgi:hypothetical protein